MHPVSPRRIVIFMACRPPDRPNEASRKSELGQSSRFGDVRATSALSLIAIICWEDLQVRFVPTTEVVASLDHLVSAGKNSF